MARLLDPQGWSRGLNGFDCGIAEGGLSEAGYRLAVGTGGVLGGEGTSLQGDYEFTLGRFCSAWMYCCTISLPSSSSMSDRCTP